MILLSVVGVPVLTVIFMRRLRRENEREERERIGYQYPKSDLRNQKKEGVLLPALLLAIMAIVILFFVLIWLGYAMISGHKSECSNDLQFHQISHYKEALFLRRTQTL